MTALLCPECNGQLRDDGKCDKCSTDADAIARRAPDPYDLADGLDVRKLENDDAHRDSQRRNNPDPERRQKQ